MSYKKSSAKLIIFNENLIVVVNIMLILYQRIYLKSRCLIKKYNRSFSPFFINVVFSNFQSNRIKVHS